MEEYNYTGNLSFEEAYHDCKLVADSIVDEESFQNADKGLLLFYMDKILEALEKQIEKVPYYSGDGYFNGELVYDTWQCPNCGEYYEVDYDTFDYCPTCGQKIKWE